MCGLFLTTGKISEYDVNSSSVHAGFRRAQYHHAFAFYFPRDEERSTIEQQNQTKVHVAQFAEKLRKFGDGQYMNIGFVATPKWKEDFWGEHYHDLLQVKEQYDPDNLFTCFHCVGSDKIYDDEETTNASATVTENFTNILFLLIAVLICAC